MVEVDCSLILSVFLDMFHDLTQDESQGSHSLSLNGVGMTKMFALHPSRVENSIELDLGFELDLEINNADLLLCSYIMFTDSLLLLNEHQTL